MRGGGNKRPGGRAEVSVETKLKHQDKDNECQETEGNITTSEGELELGKKSVSSSSRQCTLCPKVARDRADLLAHYSLVHFRAELAALLGGGPGLVQCPECGARLRDNYYLVRHYGVSHKRVLQFLTPEQLDRANAGLNNSTSPSKSKVGTKIAAAPITDQSFSTKSDSRKWACHFCHKPPFPSKTSLHYHLAGVHFREHIQAIIRDTDACPECPKSFSKSLDLVRHVGAVHRYLDRFLPDFLLDTPQDYNEDANKEAALTKPVTTFKKKAVESDKSDDEEESDNDWSPSGDMVKKIKLDHKKKYFSYKKFVKIETSSSAAQNVLTCHICFMSNGRVFACRSKLYEHYSEVHYRDEIEFKFSE